MTDPHPPEDDPLADLVAECAERVDREGEAALLDLCARHPEHASGLRAAIQPLLHFGVIGPAAAPRRLGEFELVREIGRGGMGVVYEARQPSLSRTVALKVLPTQWAQDTRQVTRFQNEARAAGALEHPHIVPVYVIGEDQGTHYYAMQLIAGTSVRLLVAMLRRSEPVEGPTATVLKSLMPAQAGAPARSGSATTAMPGWSRCAAELLRQAASALDRAHAAGILHRDIKPGNLLVDLTGHLWVTDFGLAHFVREGSDLTRSGEFVGTLAYSSPEQVGGRTAVDARSDVYSLGATLYEVVGLEPPFSGSDQAALVRKVLEEEPRPLRSLDPNVPRDLETIVHKAMAKEPDRRYQNARDLAVDLEAFLAGRPIAARPITRAQRVLRWCRRNPLLAGAIACVTAFAAIAGGVGYAALEVATERDRAQLAEQRLTRLSARRRIETIRQAVEVERQNLRIGSRAASLANLRDARAEVESAAADDAERKDLLFQLRNDAVAVLGTWDATVEPLVGKDWPEPLAFDAACKVGVAQAGTDLVVFATGGGELARLSDIEPQATIAFHPAGEWLAVASRQRVRLWHWKTGRLLEDPSGTAVAPVCWSSDGREVLACTPPPLRVVACDLGSGAWRDVAPVAVEGETFDARSVTPNPDGQKLVVCLHGIPEVRLCDLGRPGSPATSILLRSTAVSALWEPDGQHVLLGCEVDLLRLDVASRVVVAEWPGHRADVMRIERDSTSGILASRGWDGQVRLWEPRGRCLLTIDNKSRAGGIAFDPDGRHVGWQRILDAAGAPAGIGRWRLQPPPVLRELSLPGHQAPSPKVVFHPTLPLLAVTTRTAVVFLDLATGAVLGEQATLWPERLAFIDEDWLFVGAGKGGCRLIKVDGSQAPQVRVGRPRRVSAARNSMAADASGNLMCAWDTDRLRLVSLRNQELRSLAVELPPNPTVRMAPGGGHAAVGTFGGDAAVVIDLQTGKEVLSVPAWEKTAATAFSPDGRLLLVLGRDQHRVFETRSWQPVATIPRRRNEVPAGFGAFSPDGSLLAVATAPTRVQLLRVADFTPVLEFDMPDGWLVGEPCFSPDGASLAIASRQRWVFLWDLRAARHCLRELNLDWSQDPLPEPPPRPAPLRADFER